MIRQNAAILTCLLIFFTINLTSLNERPVTVDDLDSLKHINGRSYKESLSLVETVGSVALLSPEHAPGYYLVLNAWSKLVGSDLFSARLLSVFFGLIAAAFVYRLMLLTRNQRGALVALLAIALLAYFHYYSQIARVYSLLPLFCAWILWSYWRVINEPKGSLTLWLSFFAAAAFILYVHYVGFLLLAAVGLYHMLMVPKRVRWLQVLLVMAAASLPFTLWLPVAMRGFTDSQASLAHSALSFSEAFVALLRLYSNGLWILPVVAAVILVLKRKRLNDAEKYLVLVALAVSSILLLVNEVTPILVERRMRYTLVLIVPLSCALAIALCQLPHRRWISLAMLALWAASSVLFASSYDLEVYTNRRSLNLHLTPHFQDFIYRADELPGHNELILSFYPRDAVSKLTILRYYRLQLSEWAHVAEMFYDAQGQLIVESSLTTLASPEGITENSQGVWLIHNPRHTSAAALEEDYGWFTQQFRFCKRYLEKAESIIDYYLKPAIPCELITDAQPLAIHYDNGAELGNLIYERSSDTLTIFLRWAQTIDAAYSFTLQIFDSSADKVAQHDTVISDDPIDIATFDLTALPAGDYVVKLIVYDRESIVSQPGVLARNGQAFEREVDVLHFSVRR